MLSTSLFFEFSQNYFWRWLWSNGSGWKYSQNIWIYWNGIEILAWEESNNQRTILNHPCFLTTILIIFIEDLSLEIYHLIASSSFVEESLILSCSILFAPVLTFFWAILWSNSEIQQYRGEKASCRKWRWLSQRRWQLATPLLHSICTLLKTSFNWGRNRGCWRVRMKSLRSYWCKLDHFEYQPVLLSWTWPWMQRGVDQFLWT